MKIIPYLLLACAGTLFVLLIIQAIKHPSAPQTEYRSLRNSDYIIVYDGCEYIVFNEGQREISVVHKGNCTNQIHAR